MKITLNDMLYSETLGYVGLQQMNCYDKSLFWQRKSVNESYNPIYPVTNTSIKYTLWCNTLRILTVFQVQSIL